MFNKDNTRQIRREKTEGFKAKKNRTRRYYSTKGEK